MKDSEAIIAALARPARGRVLATLVAVEGSSYRRAGARMLVLAGGRGVGSLSGGCLEEDIIQRARRVSRLGRPEIALYDTTAEGDLVWGTGTGCHGVVRVLLEPVPRTPAWARAAARNMQAGRRTPLRVVWDEDAGRLGTRLAAPSDRGRRGVLLDAIDPPPSLAIFGAGNDARPLCRLAIGLGWKVTVADTRPAFATPRRFPGAQAVVAARADGLVAAARLRPASAAVVMTHRYAHDLPILRDLLAMPLAYVGLLGPRLRARRLLRDLGPSMRLTAAVRARLHAPVGLDLGADGAAEVALSIAAEIQSVLAARDGKPLRERTLPIHG